MDTRTTRQRVLRTGRRSTAGQLSLAPAPPFAVYYGLRRFLLVAQSFSLDRRRHPYRRLSATLILARKAPVQLRVGNDQVIGRALLIAPGVERRHIIGVNSEVAIFDVSVGTRQFSALRSALSPDGVRVMDTARFADLEPVMATAFRRHLSEREAEALFHSAIELASDGGRHEDLDPRVRQALEIIDELPFDELSPESLATRIGLSASRLRHLFRSQLGCSLTQYQRWSATWKAVVLMTESDSLTHLAHQIGFYDLAHFDHAFIDIFGLSPSELLNSKTATLMRYLR